MSQKIKVTAQQRANALEALNVMWPSVPHSRVARNLNEWRIGASYENNSGEKAPSCGTVACFGGWCAWWPSFMAQGVSAEGMGVPVILNQDLYGLDVAEKLFGHRELFRYRCGARPDDSAKEGISDHALVTHRLEWLITNSEVA